MPPESRQVPLSPQSDAAGRRLHIHGIQEMPAGYDAEVAELFRDLRAATALTEMDLAARLGTRAEVVQSLEQGALYALPPWAETCRVVNAYGALLNLDVRPLLRRIYAQLEAGIVELQPKHMPDVPMMTPPAEPQDYSFAPSNAGGASAPNPLDIPWPPPAQQVPPPPQRNAWPNGPTAPAQQPQAPWQHAQPQPQPQPQPAWPNPQSPQQQPQAWPGNQPAPQAARPNPQPQPQRQAQPQMQPQPADRRSPQPRAPQPQAPQPQPQARPQPLPPRPAPPPEPHPLDADFGESVPLQAAPEPEKPKRRVGLLKWGLGALVISIVAFGLWMALTHAPDPSGVTGSGAPSGTIDPDDPRSRKADRLPSPPGG
jgi:hypothetical protein